MFGLRQFSTRSGRTWIDPPIRTYERKANAWTGAYGWAVGTRLIGPQFYVEGRVEPSIGGQ